MAKHALLIIVFAIITCNTYAQDQTYKRLSPFTYEKFAEQLNDNSIFKLDTMHLKIEAPVFYNNNTYSMKSIDVPEDEMAQMPNMEIKKDVHYTMLIKKYNLQYPYEPYDNPDSTILFNKKLPKPVMKPKE